MLRQVAEGVLIHESEFCQSNAVVVQGGAGVLLIDPGVLGSEMACLANDLSDSGQTVVAGFSTHPHWDHMLWPPPLGTTPRYGTARCAATARDRLSDPGAKARIAQYMIPPDITEQVPLDLLGGITGLPAESAQIPWDAARWGHAVITTMFPAVAALPPSPAVSEKKCGHGRSGEVQVTSPLAMS